MGLIDPAPAVQRILDLTGVSLTVPSYTSTDDALGATGDAMSRP